MNNANPNPIDEFRPAIQRGIALLNDNSVKIPADAKLDALNLERLLSLLMQNQLILSIAQPPQPQEPPPPPEPPQDGKNGKEPAKH